MGECGKRERKVARRKQQWPTAAVATLTITYFAFTRTACIKATTAATAAAAATATAAAAAAAATGASGHKHQCSRGSGKRGNSWGRRWQQRWRQDLEQRDIQPRGWWSRTQLLGPSVAIFSSGIPQASWWRCAHRRDPEVGDRLSVWTWPQPETTDGRNLEPGHASAAAAAPAAAATAADGGSPAGPPAPLRRSRSATAQGARQAGRVSVRNLWKSLHAERESEESYVLSFW